VLRGETLRRIILISRDYGHGRTYFVAVGGVSAAQRSGDDDRRDRRKVESYFPPSFVPKIFDVDL
jgi:hypothetical protein